MFKSLWKQNQVSSVDRSDESTTPEVATVTDSKDDVSSDLPTSHDTKLAGEPERAILSDEDELFLRRVVSQEEEEATLSSGPTIENEQDNPRDESDSNIEQQATANVKKSRWEQYRLSRDRQTVADDLLSAAKEMKAQSESSEPAEIEAGREKRDVNALLSRLDLSAINNRVVGLSNDTQKLLESFNQVLKDLVNGVPTAYDDLERLLSERQNQLDKLFGTLPPFLQKLVKTIPTRAYAMLAPQIVAATTAKKGEDTSDKDPKSEDEKEKSKKRALAIPSLRDLVTKKGAVVAMLRSIVSFIETRFPMLLAGTNVVMSLAVFILLFVFWYCHKRGRQVRLEKEKTESDALDEDIIEQDLELSEDTDDSEAELKRQIDTSAEQIEKRA